MKRIQFFFLVFSLLSACGTTEKDTDAIWQEFNKKLEKGNELELKASCTKEGYKSITVYQGNAFRILEFWKSIAQRDKTYSKDILVIRDSKFRIIFSDVATSVGGFRTSNTFFFEKVGEQWLMSEFRLSFR